MKTVLGGYSSWLQLKAGDRTHDFTARDAREATSIQQAIIHACGVR